MRRRDFVNAYFATALFSVLSVRTARAAGSTNAVTAWLCEMVTLKDLLKAGYISATDWQTRIEQLNTRTPLSDIVDWLDIDQMASRFSYATRLAEFDDPPLPSAIIGTSGMQGWFFRAFGMRRDGGLLPHIHNGMVSAHLVVSGSFRARTHDRLEDLDDAVVLRPVRDAVLRPGDILTMSDARENQHWLRALEDRSMTLDLGIYDVPGTIRRLPAWLNSTILIDPTGRAERDGTIVAPVLTFAQAASKFA